MSVIIHVGDENSSSSPTMEVLLKPTHGQPTELLSLAHTASRMYMYMQP
jgi:hypothetical protein